MPDLGLHPAHGTPQEDDAQHQRNHLRDGEAEPHQVQHSCPGQEPRRRQQRHQLPAHGADQRVDGVADGLADGAGDDIESRQQEGVADDPQGHRTDGEHLLRGVEKAQQRSRDQVKGRTAHTHNHCGGGGGELEGLFHPVQPGSAAVIGDDGHHAVVQTENGHEDEALELEVGPEDGGGRVGKADENLVHAEGHDRADGLHHNRGQPHPVNLPDNGPVRADVPEADVDLRVMPQIDKQANKGGDNLPQHRGGGGARHLHPGETEETED